jgi:transcriptional regulator with XRE-family HTH domain
MNPNSLPIMNDIKICGSNLKKLRKSKRMLQEDVAELLGISREAVSKIETGWRELAVSGRRLLEWYFFGKVPPSTHPFTEASVSYRSSSVTFSFG